MLPTVDLGAPRAASVRPPRAVNLRSAHGPSGAMRDRSRWRTFSSVACPPAFVRLALLTHPAAIARPKQGATPNALRNEKGRSSVSRQKRLYWGAGAAPRAPPTPSR